MPFLILQILMGAALLTLLYGAMLIVNDKQNEWEQRNKKGRTNNDNE